MPSGRHFYAKAYDTVKATLCAYPQYDHALPHWKFLSRCCASVICINADDQGTDDQYSETTPSMLFQIYHTIARCNSHGILTLKDNKIGHMCNQESLTDKFKKHQKRASYYGENNIQFSYQFLYSIYTKVGLSPTTCAHTW